MNITIKPNTLISHIDLPPSKSIAARVIACSALAGDTIKHDDDFCDDINACANVANIVAKSIKKKSLGVLESCSVSCMESALCYRMFSVIIALLDLPIQLITFGSLKLRQLDNVNKVIDEIKSTIHSGIINIEANDTSQIVTGLLISLPLLHNSELDYYRLNVKNLVSQGYAELTVSVMKLFGIEVAIDNSILGLTTFTIPIKEYKANNFKLNNVEGDMSAAAFMLVASAIHPDKKPVINNINYNSIQPDFKMLSFIDTLKNLKAFEFDATDTPDLFPPLTVLALACSGVSYIKGVHRLIYKESNRAQALITEFTKLGCILYMQDDKLIIHGKSCIDSPCNYLAWSHNDHRIAMALAIMANSGLLGGNSSITIQDAECVSKSWPQFFDLFFA